MKQNLVKLNDTFTDENLYNHDSSNETPKADSLSQDSQGFLPPQINLQDFSQPDIFSNSTPRMETCQSNSDSAKLAIEFSMLNDIPKLATPFKTESYESAFTDADSQRSPTPNQDGMLYSYIRSLQNELQHIYNKLEVSEANQRTSLNEQQQLRATIARMERRLQGIRLDNEARDTSCSSTCKLF